MSMGSTHQAIVSIFPLIFDKSDDGSSALKTRGRPSMANHSCQDLPPSIVIV